MPGYYKWNHKSVDRKVWTPNFKKFSKEREVKLKKGPGLAPNSYKVTESYNSTQLKLQTTTFLKCKRFVDADLAIKKKAFVPAPGHYQIENAEKMVYKRFGPQRR